ncbi:hypothetical protein HDU85_003542 [Gaertneriomyces sp. JEL0708]|nr:hypothetical protein HDU85_003542 [Gaertneriomyces sp. JEL0708]
MAPSTYTHIPDDEVGNRSETSLPGTPPQRDGWDDFDFDDEENELLALDDLGDDALLSRLSNDRRRQLDEEAGNKRNVGSTVWDATFNFANSIIGAGIIGLPYAFLQAGFLTGLVLLFTLTFVVDWTVNLLIKDAKLAGKSSYQDMIFHCWGSKGYAAISALQVVFAYGGSPAYAVIVGDTLPLVFRQVVPSTSFLYPVVASRQSMIILCTLFVSLPLSLYRDISKLAKTSAVSLLAIAFIVMTVVVAGPMESVDRKGVEDPWTVIRPGVVNAVGVISFAFVCHHNTFLIYGSLKKPTMDRFAIVTHLSTGLSLLACLVLACAGYLTFREKTQGNILNSFSPTPLPTAARFLFGLNMFLTFPLECIVCREVIFNYFYAHPAVPVGERWMTEEVNQKVDWKVHAAVTGALSVSAMAVAVVTCDLGIVLELTGGLAASILAYILPPLCYIRLTSGATWSLKNIPQLCCVAFGIAIVGVTVVQTFIKMIEGGEGKQCM